MEKAVIVQYGRDHDLPAFSLPFLVREVTEFLAQHKVLQLHITFLSLLTAHMAIVLSLGQ